MDSRRTRQAQSWALVDPGGEAVLAGQGAQATPSPADRVPAGHGEQYVAPSRGATDPGGQAAHTGAGQVGEAPGPEVWSAPVAWLPAAHESTAGWALLATPGPSRAAGKLPVNVLPYRPLGGGVGWVGVVGVVGRG